MELSIMLAQVLSVYLVVVAVSYFAHKGFWQETIAEMLNNKGLIVIGGALALLIGMLVVVTHNVWVADWPVIITIFGWLAVLKGLIRLLAPKSVPGIIRAMSKPATLNVLMIIMLVLGLYLGWAGYFA